jgi:two-component sensor histidine kinase
MQMRRLDRVTAEQALSDSISRIISIALVHETLSQEEIGMVDLGRLLGSISKLPESDSMAKYVTTLDVSGPPVLIPSREATSLALVINELVQNAVQHGFCDREEGKLALKVDHKNGKVSITVQDNGPGLPPGFEAERDGNLGLTIVRTLIEDELKGQFTIKEDRGTQAEVTFPLPGHYYPMQ